MKIYLADTITREYLGYHIYIPIQNHLESYWALINRHIEIEDWGILKNKGVTNVDSN